MWLHLLEDIIHVYHFKCSKKFFCSISYITDRGTPMHIVKWSKCIEIQNFILIGRQNTKHDTLMHFIIQYAIVYGILELEDASDYRHTHTHTLGLNTYSKCFNFVKSTKFIPFCVCNIIVCVLLCVFVCMCARLCACIAVAFGYLLQRNCG